MKTFIISVFTVFILISCGGKNSQKTVEQADDSTVYVYYFHGKQRCKTCIAVEDVTKQTITNEYNGNDKVQFVEVKTDEAVNASLVEKYQVTWNALIIAKGEDHIDITNDAFATAVESSEILAEHIKTEVNKRLE